MNVRPAALLVLLLLGLVGCSKPAEPPPIEIRRPRVVRQRPAPTLNELASPDVVESPRRPTEAGESERGKGLIYKNDRVRDVPWSINLLKVDRSRSDLGLTTTLGTGRVIGLGTLSAQIEALPSELGQPVAAVNGDFYRTEHEPYAGDPRGLQITRGELVSAPNGKTAFWIDTNGVPSVDNVASRFAVTWPDGQTTPFGLNEERQANEAVLYTPRAGSSTHTGGGREFVLSKAAQSPWLPLQAGQTYAAQIRDVREGGNSRIQSDTLVLSIGPALAGAIPRLKPGDVLRISTATSPNLTGVELALGGGPVLVHEGKVQSARANKSRERHPRTAFGWNNTHYYFVQVDGRQHGFSVGMTLPELATYLAREGCQEAINLDGGGSSEMWIEGEVVNRPCFGYERSTANGLVVVRKPKTLSAGGM